jgi:uncharacterized membrane protein YhaH (DUF805 family)
MEESRSFAWYFDFKGRLGRAEYWKFMAVVWGGGIAVLLVGAGVGIPADPLAFLIFCATVIPQASATNRRLHDIGESGWLLVGYIGLGVVAAAIAANYTGSLAHIQKLAFAPIAWGAYFVFLLLKRTQEGENEYGWPSGEVIPSEVEATAVATPGTPLSGAHLDQIERLADLRSKGLLTDEEFTAQKAKLLGA